MWYWVFHTKLKRRMKLPFKRTRPLAEPEEGERPSASNMRGEGRDGRSGRPSRGHSIINRKL